jgi:hypothetical protein
MTKSPDAPRPTSTPDTDGVEELAKPSEVDPHTGTDDTDTPIDNPAG